jgi:hypothetical protein
MRGSRCEPAHLFSENQDRLTAAAMTLTFMVFIRTRKIPVVILFRFCRVGLMKSLHRFFIPLLLVGWLIAISPDALSILSGLLSPVAADSSQTTAPADSDDHSEDAASLDDCALQNRRIELPVRVVSVVRLPAVAFHPLVSRQAPAFALPHVWQFVQRAAASPRAPSRLA